MAHQTILRGVVRGKSIELDELPGFPDGQEVTVTVQPVTGSAIPGTPSNSRLRELAAKHPPSREWFEAEEEDLF